jgi:hypothetical protein
MQEFFKKLLKNDFFIVGVILVLLFVILNFMQPSSESLENTAEPASPQLPMPPVQAPPPQIAPDQQALPPLTPENLLQPNSEAAEFVQKNEVMDLLKEQNFLVAGHHVGLDTVLQSNKIAYHDLRSAPPISKEQVGPWNQSSYEQPAGGPVARRFLEIGSQ